MKTTQWFRLDNVAKVFPVLAEQRHKNYFRLVVELQEKINPILLQTALDKTIKRFPTFQVRLRKGFFWFYLEHYDQTPKIIPETNFLGQINNVFSEHQFLFHVLYHECRIALEIFHSITDGKGGIEFLKSLTFQYLIEKKENVHADQTILNPLDQVQVEETTDSFHEFLHQPIRRKFAPVYEAYHIKGTPFDFGGHYLLHAHFPLTDMLTFCRTQGTTLTAFFAAVVIQAIAKEQQKKFFIIRKPVIIMIPIDLRKHFPSKTLRNFLTYVYVGGMIKPSMTFEDILALVNQQLKEGIQPEILKPQIASTLIIEKSPWIRLVPLFIKNWVTRLAYSFLGDPSYSFILSNLGKIEVSPSMKNHIHHFEFILSSSKLIPMTLGLCSFEDELVLTFSRNIHERNILRHILETIQTKSGIHAWLNGNRWEEK